MSEGELLSVSFSANGARHNLTGEAAAAFIKKHVEAGPEATLVGRLRGEAFLHANSALCLERRIDLRTMDAATPRERADANRHRRTAELIEQAADMIERLHDAKEPTA